MYLIDFFKQIVKERRLLISFAKRDFTFKYLGSYLGVIWAFIHPTIMILIYWFVFQVGFRSMPIGDIPFILWLLTGMVPWLFFSESVSGATTSIIDNAHLVKKVVFPINLLPIVRLISASFVHLFFAIFLFVMFLVYGFEINMYYLQYLYYLFATIVLVLGLTLITSSLVVFVKDVGQFVNMILQFGFWLTPIFWSFDLVPEKFQGFFKLNPLFYIVDGYRQTFIYHTWFWERPSLTLYFWAVAFTLLGLGVYLFQKLRSHFADVL